MENIQMTGVPMLGVPLQNKCSTRSGHTLPIRQSLEHFALRACPRIMPHFRCYPSRNNTPLTQNNTGKHITSSKLKPSKLKGEFKPSQ